MRLRRTKIVCTLGPASASEEQIEALMRAGMDVARINFSHGSRSEHALLVQRIRAVAERLDRPVAILQDLQGPKIRTGTLENGACRSCCVQGRALRSRHARFPAPPRSSPRPTRRCPRDVKPGDRVLLSDGAIELRVRSVSGPDVVTEVVNGGALAQHQGINLPGVAVSAPALTAKDREDLVFGIWQGVDYIALSFVRQASTSSRRRT